METTKLIYSSLIKHSKMMYRKNMLKTLRKLHKTHFSHV